LAKTTILFGVMLILLGFFAYVLSGAVSLTALIPSAFGAPLAILGLFAMKPTARKHAMHAAAAIALIGFFGTVPGIIALAKWAGGTRPERPPAVITQVIMSVICAAFVMLCVRSFIDARRRREAESTPPA
jgi:hypothetical protein